MGGLTVEVFGGSAGEGAIDDLTGDVSELFGKGDCGGEALRPVGDVDGVVFGLAGDDFLHATLEDFEGGGMPEVSP